MLCLRDIAAALSARTLQRLLYVHGDWLSEFLRQDALRSHSGVRPRTIGLHAPSDMTDPFWRDMALTEMSRAVFSSFREAGVTVVDHHSASAQYIEFHGRQQARHRRVAGDWLGWTSGATSLGAATGDSHKSGPASVVAGAQELGAQEVVEGSPLPDLLERHARAGRDAPAIGASRACRRFHPSQRRNASAVRPAGPPQCTPPQCTVALASCVAPRARSPIKSPRRRRRHARSRRRWIVPASSSSASGSCSAFWITRFSGRAP